MRQKMMSDVARLAFVAVLVACAASDDAADDAREGAAPADAAETSTAAEAGVAPASDVAPDADAEIELPTLDDDAIRRWSDAVRVLATDPVAGPRAVMDADRSIAETAQLWERDPAIRAALERADLSVREYVGLSTAVVGALMGSGMLTDEQIRELPTQVERDNIAYVKANQSEIQALMEELQGLSGK